MTRDHEYSTHDLSMILGVPERQIRRLIDRGTVKARVAPRKAVDGLPSRTRYLIAHAEVCSYVQRTGSLEVSRRFAAYLANPQRSYNIGESAAMLGCSRDHLWRCVKEGRLKAHRYVKSRGWRWRVEHRDLVAFAVRCPIRTVRMAGVAMSRPPGALLLAATADKEVARGIEDYAHEQVTSLFALGGLVEKYPAWAVVIDWATAGWNWANDAAERLREERPGAALVAVSDGERMRGLRPGLWDLILPRPVNPGRLAAGLKRLDEATLPRRVS